MKPRKLKQPKPQTNFYDVCINFTNKLFLLFNSGNFFGGMAFAAFIIIFFRYPSEDLPILTRDFFYAFFGSKFYHAFIGLFLIFFLLLALHRTKKVKDKEIKRLTNLRKELIHGIEEGKLTPLSTHYPSGFNLSNEERDR